MAQARPTSDLGHGGPQSGLSGTRKVFLRVQPEVLGAFQFRRPSLPGFPLPNGVNRLADMAHDGKADKDDLF